MNITRHENEDLTAEITISLTPQDYEERVNEGIKKVQRQAQMPGFRPGKVPAGLIRKQYGTQIMVDEINKLLNDTIYKYIEENKLDILGNPIPKDQTSVDFARQKEFEFVYQLGLAPDFKVDLNKSLSFNYKTVEVNDELVERYMKDVRRNHGQAVHPETAGEKDTLFVDINELDETGAIKPGGIFKSTSVSMERLKSEAARTKLLGAKKEEKIVVNVNDLYESAVDKSVSLGVEKEAAENLSCDLQLTVKNISRLEEAEIGQELFDRVYGEGKISSGEEFREKIRQELALMFRADSERFFRQEVERKLVERANLRLPHNFLRKWLKAVNEKPITEEDLDREYPDYAKAMQWRLIENKIVKDNNIKVSADEARQEASNYIRGEFAKYGQQPTDDDLARITRDLLSKEKEAQKIYESLYTKKVLDLIKETCTIEEKKVDHEEFFKG